MVGKTVGTVLVVVEKYVRPGEPSPCTPIQEALSEILLKHVKMMHGE
jgi:hypothetical protein